MSDHRTREPRYRVHLEVRFQVARDFVVEYAENLSKGGLFVRGAEGLQPLEERSIAIELPGMGQFDVVGRVAHILDAETAARVGRKPGAGFQIVQSPPGFQEALGDYLLRLGRRRDAAVLATDVEFRRLLDAAGYDVAPAGMPEEVVSRIAHSERPVIALIVERANEDAYRRAVTAAGAAEIVRGIDYLEELDDLLVELDGELP